MYFRKSFLHVVPLASFFLIILVSLFVVIFNAIDLKQMIARCLLVIVASCIFLFLYFLYVDALLKEQKIQMVFWSFILLGYIPSIFLIDFNLQILTILLMAALITSMIHVRLGLFTNFVMLSLLIITKQTDIDTVIFYALSGSFICLTLPQANNREKMVYVAIGNFFALSILNILIQLNLVGDLKFNVMNVLLSGLNGFLVIILVYGSEPIWETVFRITSSARLIELSNSNEPLLQRLLIETPGTYHHSMLVANLAEKAAQDISADYHLARAGALYHDIGKLQNPEYFIENQKGYNIHDELAPDSSAQYIKRHISDGMQLAKEYKLPESVKDIIIQHQGNAIISYFYTKALEHSDGFEIDKTLFMYDGPKPQTKEAAIVMLADCVEAAVKSLEGDKKTVETIQIMIKKVTHSVFVSGQLDACPLLFKELLIIEAAFLKVYNGMYHERIRYEREM